MMLRRGRWRSTPPPPEGYAGAVGGAAAALPSPLSAREAERLVAIAIQLPEDGPRITTVDEASDSGAEEEKAPARRAGPATHKRRRREKNEEEEAVPAPPPVVVAQATPATGGPVANVATTFTACGEGPWMAQQKN